MLNIVYTKENIAKKGKKKAICEKLSSSLFTFTFSLLQSKLGEWCIC